MLPFGTVTRTISTDLVWTWLGLPVPVYVDLFFLASLHQDHELLPIDLFFRAVRNTQFPVLRAAGAVLSNTPDTN